MYDGKIDALHNMTGENSDTAIMSISQIVDYYNLLHFPKTQVLKTKQYVQSMPFCMYFRKHSSLEKPFNQQINLYSSSGLIVTWAEQFKKPSYKSERMEPKALSLDQIIGLLIICFCLIAASVIMFIFELMSNNHETVRIIMDFLTFKTNMQRTVGLQI